MNHKLALLHTSAALIPVFDHLCDSLLPSIDRFHLSDDSLIKDVIANNYLSPRTARRVVNHVIAAEEAGATCVLVTCSSIGPAVELAQNLVDVPVHRVDQAMANLAVTLGTKIQVIATLPTTLEPTRDLIARQAAIHGKKTVINAHLCEGAFALLMEGQTSRHDHIVKEAILAATRQVDVIVLAQASMARVSDTLRPDDRLVPILSSPELAVRELAKTLQPVT